MLSEPSELLHAEGGLFTMFRGLFQKLNRSKTARRDSRIRLNVETLEGRWVPAGNLLDVSQSASGVVTIKEDSTNPDGEVGVVITQVGDGTGSTYLVTG